MQSSSMSTSTVGSKGQIVIPSAVRADMGAQAGTRVELFKAGDGWLLKPSARTISALKGIVPKPAHPVSLADMASAVRRHSTKMSSKK